MATAINLTPVKNGTPLKKTCSACPQFLPSGNQARLIGKSVGAAVCAKTMQALERPQLDPKSNARAQDAIAKSCSSFGTRFEPDSNAPQKALSFSAAFPAVVDGSSEKVSDCSSCDNYINATSVRVTYGWNAGMCKATGRLLLDDRLSRYARGCEYAAPDKGGYKLDPPLVLKPWFNEGFGVIDPKAKLVEFAKGTGDPMEHPGDRNTLSARAKEAGIRAWRKVPDPKGYGPDAYLPIFDHSLYSEDELARVPKVGDDEAPEDYEDYLGLTYQVTVAWNHLGLTPALWGEPGNGKTEFFRYMAWLMVLPFTRVSISGSTELDDLEGKMMYDPAKGTYFVYGQIASAWTTKNVLAVDEPNVGQPDVWQFIRPLTDNSRQLVIARNQHEILKAHDGCYMGMAMNPAWDPRNVGTQVLGAADGSRLLHYQVTAPPDDVMEKILRKVAARDKWTGPKMDESIKTVIAMANEVRQHADEGALPFTVGTRDFIKTFRLCKWMMLDDAVRQAFSNFLDPESSRALHQIVDSYIG